MTEPTDITLAGAGLRLAATEYGEPDAPPILLLHGGGQTRHSWGTAGRRFAERGFRAVTVDLRGHGDSDWSPDGMYSIDSFAADVLALSDAFETPPAIVGASLGGLSAMVAVGESENPAEVASKLVLVDITPRVEPEGRDHVRGFMMSGIEGFDSIEQAADAVSAYLPHRPRPKDLSGLRKNLRERAGRWYWHWDPRWLRNTEGVDGQSGLVNEQRLRDAARGVTIPTMLVRGQMSEIVSEEGVRELRELIPDAQVVDVAGAGHMVAGDKNDAFNDAIIAFIS